MSGRDSNDCPSNHESIEPTTDPPDQAGHHNAWLN